MREDWIQPILDEAKLQGLERTARVCPEAGGIIKIDGKEVLNFSSNDYLDLARHPHVIDRSRQALDQFGIGSTASRLVTGTLPIHEELEARIAKEKGYEAALVFGSGYMANAGTIPILAGRDDFIFADKLVHASMIDACKLSGAKLVRFAHNDVQAVEKRLEQYSDHAGRKLVITESVFSMDGDIAPLTEIAETAEKHGAMLMVDEAHSTGTFGPNGAGLIREHELESNVTVSMGTMSKAMAGYGGFVACSEKLRQLLVHSARAFIYTTAPPPAVIGAALGALDVFEASPRLGYILQANADYFRSLLHEAGLDTLQSQSQIIPIVIGNNEKAVAISQLLRSEGIIAAAIRPPTVPAGSARLRISITLAHLVDDLERAAKAIINAVKDT
ncbi:8-amino-7-oxononanoate synthase [Pontiella sulfatireligans]|uniref:8-amino-7-ketopelargonate synthase n=1 Tax=Pontiella sulfatireligans TaxID=2750658 RepID=A0A6C2UQ45_9BACT|nr:8-amino-7-oxononanoate synthase [Pontiella sulfatireligans]VGO22053.1 8-amino-7-oxononanoate synthase [Pontiella sulfatireligans]